MDPIAPETLIPPTGATVKTTRATRRTVRRWALRIRNFPLEDFVSLVTLHMPESDRGVLSAMLNREISRRARARNAAFNCGVGCPCGPPWSDDCR